MTNLEHILYIKDMAKQLFVGTQLTKGLDEKGMEVSIYTNAELCKSILGTIGDSGLIYLSTSENLDDLWDSFRDDVSSGTSDWLIQTASSFRILSFIDNKSYNDWVDHLASTYGSHTDGSRSGNIEKSIIEKNISIDDDLIERLPKPDEWKILLHANPWFVYLVTLQLSYHEIYSDLVYNNSVEVLKQLGVSGDVK